MIITGIWPEKYRYRKRLDPVHKPLVVYALDIILVQTHTRQIIFWSNPVRVKNIFGSITYEAKNFRPDLSCAKNIFGPI